MFSRIIDAARSLARAENFARGAALQEHVDLLRLMMLRTAHASWPDVPEQSLDSVREQAPSLAGQRTLVQDAVRAQAHQLLEAWNVERPPPPPPQDPNAPRSAEQLAAFEAVWAAEVAAAQQRAFGFELSVGPSGAGADAGDGVFLRGGVRPGSLVAFFPGVSYMPVDLYLLPGGTKRFEGSRHLMARHDSCIFDASEQALGRLPHAATGCPLSSGHRVNHPPAGFEPNVMPCALDFDASGTPPDVLGLLPVLRHSRVELKLLGQRESREQQGGPSSSGLLNVFRNGLAAMSDEDAGQPGPLRTLALVTTRAVQDEELFLNYRLNPANGHPPWYVPVDEEEEERRWKF